MTSTASSAAQPILRQPTDARVAADQACALMEGGRTLLVSDFDGTLAGLAADPWSATILPTAQRALRRLAARDGVEVALLSGRTALDLASRTRVGGIDYLGDHGSQRGRARRRFRPAALQVDHEPVSPAVVALVRRLVEEVPGAVAEPWLVVEDKHSAVTFHVRTAPDVDEARTRVLVASDAVDQAGLLVRSGGRRALELRSADASDKGRAMRRLIDSRRPATIIVLGDDGSDALAFDVLRASRASGQLRGLAIAVVSRPDLSAAVIPSADVVLASAVEAARFLAFLATKREADRRSGASPRLP